MPETPSTMLELGTKAPDFRLPNAVDGKSYSLDDFKGAKGLLVMFICNHCPYVLHVMSEFKRLETDYAAKGLKIVAINANSSKTHPQDGPQNMKTLAQKEGWGFPFLFDESQAVAKAYQAACTPDFFLFSADKKLAYRGQLDDSRPGNGKPVTASDLRAAVEAVITGKPAAKVQKPSVGCNIKWHPGSEPK